MSERRVRFIADVCWMRLFCCAVQKEKEALQDNGHTSNLYFLTTLPPSSQAYYRLYPFSQDRS
jgi:hypothetical protein